ncbi:CLUMA_CG006273, isoform A [Clunio marinus]|uniref:COP9 signalosome complex subunit 6 n=1 Tax=Clunio marinus TaxID=568069 RepID=A0A1J1I344_9DIPT|nr:CLUMA_CG006273, isoform A [Clunio marinus]
MASNKPGKGLEKMEIDEIDQSPSTSASIRIQKQILAKNAVPSVSISLHPLVLMNIAEHWTRIRAQEGRANAVYGALIGKQDGRKIEVYNSFELRYEVIDDDVIINRDYYNTKEEQYKQVFSDLDFLGWYTTAPQPNEKHIKIHRQICQINESPILLQMDTSSKHVEQLPIQLFESVIDIVAGEATMLFVPLTYTLATEEAERIGVDHVARHAMAQTNDSGGNSFVAEHLVAQHVAIKMLHSRIKLVLEYVKDVQDGKLKPNLEILREAFTLSHRLPVVQSPAFKEEFHTQSNDVGLITYLGTLTKAANDINQLVNKFNLLHDRQSRRMRFFF